MKNILLRTKHTLHQLHRITGGAVEDASDTYIRSPSLSIKKDNGNNFFLFSKNYYIHKWSTESWRSFEPHKCAIKYAPRPNLSVFVWLGTEFKK